MSTLIGLECPECGGFFDADRPQSICNACDSPLFARYDFARVGDRLDPGQVALRERGLWRWADLLPVRDPDYRLTLGEGDTQLLSIPRIAQDLGLETVFVKDEGANPTGTFKARGMAVAVSRAAELGLDEFVLPTAGNAGGALVAYAARAGLRGHVYMPSDARTVHQVEVRAAGAELQLIDGMIDEAAIQALAEAETQGWFNLSTFREPYRVEGKKTMGFELAEAFGWDVPEVIIYPTGGGTGLVGIWKAFKELEALGWIDGRRPRMVSVQAAGCAPIVRAFEKEMQRAEVWENAETEVHGLRVPGVFADRLILDVLRQSQGTAVTVTDDEIRQAQANLAAQEGILTCLEGAATLAGLSRLVENGAVAKSDRIVLLNTGTGLKDLP